jgi:hypothetical protein
MRAGAVEVYADIALLGEKWRPRVHANAHLNRPGRERLDHLPRSRKRTRRGREGDEEGVALRVHLDPVVSRAGLADHPPVLGERFGVSLGAE